MTLPNVVALALLLSLCACASQPTRPNIQSSTLLQRTVTVNNEPHKFAIWVPAAYDRNIPAPCVLFLHGLGECGTDGLKQTTVGLLPAAKADPAQWPCIIVMPQKPVQDAEWEDYEPLVLACLDAAEKELNIDKRRTSLTGLSQGGHGTWVIGARHPDLFCALAPVCGYVHRRNGNATTTLDLDKPATLQPLAHKPIWAFHGEKDDIVPPEESKRMIAAIKQIHTNPEPRLTLFPEANHNSWDNAYRSEKLGTWLRRETQ
jgi:predicted peptidase